MGKIRLIKAMLIAVFISVELIALLSSVGLSIWCPWLMEKVGELFTQGLQMYCILVGLPAAGLAFGYKTLSSLLHPADAEKKGLYNWPDYPLLRYYGYIPLLLCAAGIITPVAFFFTNQLLSKLLMGTLYSAITLAWIVSIITLGMAKLRISALLGGAN